MYKAVIAGYARSPFTMAKKGELIDIKPVNLLSEVIKKLVTQSKINPNDIEDIVVGDEVLSYNGKDLVVSKVIATKPTIVGHRNLLTLAGDGICNIEFTPEHPFLTKEGWKSVTPEEKQYGTLEPGDEINCCGAWKKISSIDIIDSTPDKKVYNFTVKEFHSYVANGIIVHNK